MANVSDLVVLEERGDHVRATLTLPNGRVMRCVLNCASPEKLSGELDALEGMELGADEELGGFLSKLKSTTKKIGKVALAPVKVAHKYTHQKGPIAALHKKVQEGVAKALPVTKPFIKVHNSLAKPVHKAIEGKKIKNAVTAKEIAKVTAKLPPAKRGAVQVALVAEAKKADALKSIGKAAAKAQVLSAAKVAAKKGSVEAKAVLKRAAVTGTYKVTTPSGRVISVPAAKVAHT